VGVPALLAVVALAVPAAAQREGRRPARRTDAGFVAPHAGPAGSESAGADAAAEPAVDPALEAFRRMVREDPFTDRADDPIGLDARDEEMRTMRLPEPEELVEERIPPQAGAVLTAVAGVRETWHTMEIELREGIAIAREEMRFTSSARLPAEVRYRLGVPEGAALVGLEICGSAGCRTGLPERDRSGPLSAYDDAARARGAGERALPIGHAVATRDEAGDAIVVRAAPVVAGCAPLVVRVQWALRTPVHGGRIRFLVPARGIDARVVDAQVSVRAIDLVAPAIDGTPSERRAEARSPASPFAITAALPQTAGVRATAAIVPCSAGRCARLRALAGRPQIDTADVILAIDASPSTMASARGRIAPTARVLLSMLPAGTRVRAVAFAARAEEITSGWSAPTAIDAGRLQRSVELDLGPATRFEAIWTLAGGWVREGTRIVIIGDGGLTEGPEGAAALRAAREAGAVLASVNVADRPSTPALRQAIESAGGLAIDAGSEADDAAAGRGQEPLESRISAVLAPIVVRQVSAHLGDGRLPLGALRAGEEIVWEGALRGASAALVLDGATTRAVPPPPELAPALEALAVGGSVALAAVDPADLARSGAGSCSARGPYATASAVVPRETPLALAHGRRCDSPPTTTIGPRRTEERSGIPSRVLLATLRRRVVPAARACFRDDRRGRAAYEVRAPIRLELADREIVAASVGGSITPELRRCLLEAIERLEVPSFEGRLIVTWALYTAAVLPPPTLELAPETADEVDRVVRE
jgi:hypothetical protein